MKRIINIDLVAAELIKLTRSTYAQNVLLYGLFSVVVVAFTACVHSERALLRAPACFSVLNNAAFVVGMFIPALIGGWLSGHEAGSDTWKTLLVRQPTRWPFVLAKVVAGVVVVGGACTFAAFSTVALFDITGRVLGVMPALNASADTAPIGIGDVIIAVVHNASTGAVAFSLGLLAKTNSTAVGVSGGVITQWLFGMLGNAGTDLTSAKHTARVLAAIDDVIDGTAINVLELLGSVVVVCCWTIVPVTVAAFVFERRDLVSDA